MKKLTILIPKIKPPHETDIITNQLKNIFSKLKENFELNLIWVIFQPTKFDDYEFDDSTVMDYHRFSNATEIINKTKPNLIISEVRLGINGIIFSKLGNFYNIPVITLTPTGQSEFFSQFFSTKSNFNLVLSNKVLADSSNNQNPKKLGMLRYSLHRYYFLLKTLKNIDYSVIQRIQFLLLYPRIQIFSKSYPALHNITSGNINLCFNKHWQLRLIQAKFPNDSIIFCGDPAFDELYEKIQNKKNLHEKSDKIKIIFCPTPMHEHGWMTQTDEEKLIVNLIKNIQNLNNVEISLKIHPSSSSYNEYEKLLKSNNINVPLYQKEETLELLKKSDLLITYGSSNIILDAILMKIPVILYKDSQIPDLKRLDDSSIIVECTTFSDLSNSIQKALERPISTKKFENYVQNQIGIFDGKNSNRISDIIKNLFN